MQYGEFIKRVSEHGGPADREHVSQATAPRHEETGRTEGEATNGG